jgi:dihydrofolate reductase
VLEQEPDHALDRGPEAGPGHGRGHAIVQAEEAARPVPALDQADLIRQGLAAGCVEELTVIVAPVVLGGGKRLFDGFTQPLDLEHLGVTQSPFATFIRYRVRQAG